MDQNLDLQLAALKPLCPEQIWADTKTGTKVAGRTQLGAVIEEAKRLRATGAEVALTVSSLSRLGRRVVDIGIMVDELQAHGIGFVSISEGMTTATVARISTAKALINDGASIRKAAKTVGLTPSSLQRLLRAAAWHTPLIKRASPLR